MEYSHILDTVKAGGFRITKARQSIIQVFSHTKHPISVQDVQKNLVEHGVRINKTTIYREIDFLIKQHLIHKVKIDGKEALFEITKRNHHHHIICESCGKIEDVILENEEHVLSKVQKKTNIAIHSHAMEFYGHCSNCQ